MAIWSVSGSLARTESRVKSSRVEASRAEAEAGANLMAITWTDCQMHANNSLVQQLATHFQQSATRR